MSEFTCVKSTEKYNNSQNLLNELWEKKSESEKNVKLSESEKSEKNWNINSTNEIREKRKLYKVLHKIQDNKFCKTFDLFIQKYYLSKKQSYITTLRKNVEELYNFNNEFLLPMTQNCIENIYDNSAISLILKKPNNFSNLNFFHQEKIEDLEIWIENNNWFYLLFIYPYLYLNFRKTILIHGIEKMMLAQCFSDHYQRSNQISNFQIRIKSYYDANIRKNSLKELKSFEETTKIICTYEKNEEDVLDITINISLSSLIPYLTKNQTHFSFNKVIKPVELKFEDIDTILVTHKKMEYKMPSSLKINISGHNCLHESKSLRNFLMKLDKESNYFRIGKKPYSLNEFICDEETLPKQEGSRFSKRINKITKFHIFQYSKIQLQKMYLVKYYIEVEVQNHKSDFRLLMSLLKAVATLENIFLINFNINLLENQFYDFYDFLNKNKLIWFRNRFLISIKVNGNCNSLTQTKNFDFISFMNRKRVAFLQTCAIENLRKAKILKFRKEICHDILNCLI